MSSLPAPAPVSHELIRLGARARDKADAIAQAAQMLLAAGCVAPGYETSMGRREQLANTFLGHGVAIPHGLGKDRHLVRRDGIAVLQLPDGVEWNPGQVTRLVVGIAAQSDTHITLLRRLTRLIQDDATLQRLFTTAETSEIVTALAGDVTTLANDVPAQDLAEHFGWTIAYPNGLHARPATRWAETARSFSARAQVRAGDQAADAKSLVALLQLGLRHGDPVSVSAEGADAPALLAALRRVMEGLVAQEKADAERAAQRKAAPVAGWNPPEAQAAIVGIGASPGLAIGRIHVLASRQTNVADHPAPLGEGGARLQDALGRTRQQLAALQDDTQRRLGASDAAIFGAQAALLDDTDLITRTCQLMVEGHGVAWSWHQAIEQIASGLAALGNPVLAGRAADLRDVGRRVLAQLDPSAAGGGLADLPAYPCILLAADLSPSDTANLDTRRVLGLATAQGGPTSHTAILSRTLGLPALVAGGADLLTIEAGVEAIIDGSSGRLYLSPSDADLASARAWIAEQQHIREREAAQRAQPAQTTDGHRIDIGANVNLPEQVPLALEQGAEGVGLMRTEFLFLERGSTPSEDEQYATYRAMASALDGRPLIVRALDIGGDKQVAHLELPHEDNPFLGVRGARLLLRRPDLLEPQLRALYRAARDGARLSIMFPMITSVPELIALRAICERLRIELEAPEVPIGIMIEVPAAAAQSDVLARHADFFSIGTNDLTQYVLAIDRQNPELAVEADSLHPAVLRAIRATVDGARTHGRWVGVCGGLAGDPFGAMLLAGLGVDELSMTPNDIPAVKARLRSTRLADLQALAGKALDCETTEQVRALEGARA
ncbi:TPA: phosphoenolpyruvate--protein phosphotransferase [Stenotrophomonas maltophilia]|uniref:phosphoenolpyruvate--protein phosphotransferase n=1 Tax=Stenotrophomonas TaxID=40323 RepID=UPI0013DCBFB4|nr:MULTISPECIES: phosphoenolpyruvate--protein phosphotransferase [Stenotrophomonas]MDH2021358.1 phosphoenolpyruvate--protein phosphotransferase [Stenotrophomonas sp. GD03680]HEL3749580.1 phosphoenolpyruvate--protein phosphotransferase [Stenotrophomonas maltophilia]HEL7728133.1 phosphoenolpyruvate--protein phosphotransferase [Stenotrophomonas maltophilia]